MPDIVEGGGGGVKLWLVAKSGPGIAMCCGLTEMHIFNQRVGSHQWNELFVVVGCFG